MLRSVTLLQHLRASVSQWYHIPHFERPVLICRPLRLSALLFAVIVCGVGDSKADFPETALPVDVQSVRITDSLPWGASAIDYSGDDADDGAAGLNEQLRRGTASLKHDGSRRGYLLSLLKALDVPVESQVLVFSKTARHPDLVGPESPRAVYYNDEVYIGWIPDAASIEIAAVDPQKGPLFYTLSQREDASPRLKRANNCLACHAGSATLGVPGLMVRSFRTDEKGKPTSGYSRITHETPVSRRWGGWYVTGAPENLTHRGNVAGDRSGDPPDSGVAKPRSANQLEAVELSEVVDLSDYPGRTSSVVSHLVLNHQVHGQNLMTRVNYEARLNRRSDAEGQLAGYLLFADEADLAAPIEGDSKYREWFEARDSNDKLRHSLRRFDLKTRLFHTRLSPLINSRAFAALPDDCRERVVARMLELVNSRDDCVRIRSIIRARR